MTRLIYNPYLYYYYMSYKEFKFTKETGTKIEMELEMGDDWIVITGNKAEKKKHS